MVDIKTVKPGQKLRVIDAAGTTYLEVGKIYTVEDAENNFIHLEELIGGYNPERFELVEEEKPFPYVGQRVVVKPGQQVPLFGLEIGKVYTIERVWDHKSFVDIEGISSKGLFTSRFEPNVEPVLWANGPIQPELTIEKAIAFLEEQKYSVIPPKPPLSGTVLILQDNDDGSINNVSLEEYESSSYWSENYRLVKTIAWSEAE